MSDENKNAVSATFEVDGLDSELHLIRLEGEEGISMPFRFNLLLAAASSSLDIAGVVGQGALVTLQRDGKKRTFHGMVSSFMQRESGRKYTYYQALVVPCCARLLHRQDCRIFQQQTVKDIVGKVLQDAGVTHKFMAHGRLEKREYCVQYRESDWDFICRLLEEEGFYYFFQHGQDDHLLSIVDDKQFVPDIPGQSTVKFHPPDTNLAAEEHINLFFFGEAIQSGKVALCDFNYEKPSLGMLSEQPASKDGDLEIYDYPGLYSIPEQGRERARLWLEEAQARRVQGEGRSDCTRFSAGLAFTLEDHVREDLNGQKYLLTRVFHRVEKGREDLESGALDSRCTYGNDFSCIQYDVPFRPPRTTRKPHVQGVQTAIVVGPSGEEIYTDELGRVKVQFHWDRQGGKDQHSSCWVRVSQLWAGQGWGAIYIPRIGQEVIVDFIEGDPDRPIITGRVYHAQNVPPYPLPAEMTKSTIMSNSSPGGDGANEIRFEDKKGDEEIYTHAQKDQNEVVENDMSTTVGRDRTITVKGQRTETVKGDEAITVEGGRTETVNKDETLTVKGERQRTVNKDETITIMLNRTTDVKSKDKLTAGSKIELICGMSKITMDASGAVKIEGSRAQIQMTGPVKIQGAKLDLN